jgi:hypothetical protein
VTGANYQIFAMTGAKMTGSEILSQSTNISLQGFAPGIYLFNLSTAKNSTQTKFIIH